MKEFFEKGLLDPLELMARQVLVVLPSLLAMSIIFFAGLVVAWTASQALERLLRVVGLDRLFDRLGVTGALLRGGVKTDPSSLRRAATRPSLPVGRTIDPARPPATAAPAPD